MSLLPTPVARRSFLARSGVSLGGMALGSLLSDGAGAAAAAAVAANPGLQPGLPHFAPRAKRIIWLYMAGGMTHLDTFDNKPKLAKLHGEPMPE